MNGDRHRDRLGPKAESHRKLAFDVAELRVHHLEPNPAPRDLADRDGPVTKEERHAIAKHRTDAVDAPAPRERRVTPTEPNLDGANRRLDRQSIPPSVVADAPDSFPRARDGAPPVPAPLGREFLVIPAIEVSTKSGHVLGYGIREIVPRDLSVSETAERIVALGGVPVAAHPFRFWLGLGPAAVAEAAFPAYETCNGRTLRRGNVRARAWARERKLGETGGSDSHFLDEVAKAVTAVDAGAVGVDDVLQLLAQGRTSAQGLDRGPAATARYVTKAVGEWMLRGMRRI